MSKTIEEIKAEAFAEFDGAGEDRIRLMLQNARFTGSRKAWAIEWLANADQRSRLASEAERADANRTARSAKNAAWAAAIAAIVAAIAAIASAVIVLSGGPV